MCQPRAGGIDLEERSTACASKDQGARAEDLRLRLDRLVVQVHVDPLRRGRGHDGSRLPWIYHGGWGGGMVASTSTGAFCRICRARCSASIANHSPGVSGLTSLSPHNAASKTFNPWRFRTALTTLKREGPDLTRLLLLQTRTSKNACSSLPRTGWTAQTSSSYARKLPRTCGTGEAHYKDLEFVKAAKEMHEAKLLAKGGFSGPESSPLEARYERAEKELSARLEGPAKRSKAGS
jgi:hypothetical protein